MHELSLAEGVLELVEATARREGAGRVHGVVLEIGRLAAVDPEALKFCFASVVRGTMVDGALLEIVDLPGAAWCSQCRASVPVNERFDVCPMCGHAPLQATAGLEMRVREIRID